MKKLKDWFKNIKELLLRVFRKQKLMLDSPKISEEKKINDSSNIVQTIKTENKKNQTTKEIIDIIENNPVTLKSLNNKQLGVVEQYYKEKVIQTRENVKKVKSDISDLENYLKVLNDKVKMMESSNV